MIRVRINKSKYGNTSHFGENQIQKELGEIHCVDCDGNEEGLIHVTTFEMCGPPYNVEGTSYEDFHVIETGEIVREICCRGCKG